MITFEKIRWKNFLSTGNYWTEINLNEHPHTIIVGKNGSGKSTLLDALCFGLFNKPFRNINKPQLANSQNEKDCVVEVNFKIGKKKYLVRRGIKPNVFDVLVNGKPLHREADDRTNQKLLEQNILKLNYKSFTQIVILGSSGFVPFMQLSTSHRREVIEDLLDIKIFSAMNMIIKDRIRQGREKVISLDNKKNNLVDKVELQSKLIEEFKVKLRDLTAEIEKVSNASKSVRKLQNLKAKIDTKKENCVKDHTFFNENTVCPTCIQEIEEENRLNRIAELDASINQLVEGLSDLENKIQEEESRENRFVELSKEATSLTYEISNTTNLVTQLDKSRKTLESEIQRVTDQVKNRNSEYDKLEKYKAELSSSYENLSEEKNNLQYNDFAFSLLKDGGVKRQIVKKYLPLINQKVNKYIRMMDFFINFNLDEEFNETVQSPIHEKFSYASFSEGEKMRIDLALLFTWREVAKVRNSVNTNLLIMDEVFDSSLDSNGTQEFLKIVRYIIKDANVFVISHNSELHDKFAGQIAFEKVGSFSRLVKE
jgi:DNA repair exonuclease SbcCD ATPase subunit